MTEPDDLLKRIKDVIDADGAVGMLKQAGLYADGMTEDDFWDSATGLYFDRDGQPISLRRWSQLHVDFNYKVIARTSLHHARVSTVWLGMDHGWGGGPPVIFETMLFPRRRRDRKAPWADETYRWHTLAEARAGHHGIVDKIRNRGMNAIRTKAQVCEWEAQWRVPKTKTKRQS